MRATQLDPEVASIVTQMPPGAISNPIPVAGGIMIVTISATAFHLVRDEMSSAAITLALLAMATFVAYMRHRVVPIRARGAA